MIRSDDISELAKALSKAQGKIRHAVKDSTNPHFKSSYADLASCMEAIREPFAENGLSILQPLSDEENMVKCTTLLLHTSGQYIGSDMRMKPAQLTAHAIGSAATYLRRYMVMAIAGIAADDDDGNDASGKGQNNESKTGSTAPQNISPQVIKPVVAQPAASNVPNTPANTQTIKWSKLNAGHRKKVTDFLKSKNYDSYSDQLLNLLDGKICSQQTLTDTWRLIDPEAPDTYPGDL